MWYLKITKSIKKYLKYFMIKKFSKLKWMLMFLFPQLKKIKKSFECASSNDRIIL